MVKPGLKFRFVQNDAFFNRFYHSVGTGNKKSKLFIRLLSQNISNDISIEDSYKYFDENFAKLNKAIGPINKVDLIAEEIISYMHDCMHLPFSHLFESAIINQAGFHEKLVKRTLLKDSNYQNIFNAIHPNLGNTIAKHLTEVSIFAPLNASSLDFDRFDYILRGTFYQGEFPYNTNFPSFTFENVEINNKKVVVPVYSIKDYDIIISLLNKRVDLYTGNLGYLSTEVILADAVFGKALKTILDNSSKSSNTTSDSFDKFKQFIFSLSQEYSTQRINVNSLNFDEILQWDNISFINCLLEYAEKLDEEKDSQTIKLIALIVPPLESLLYMISSMKCVDYQHIEKDEPEFIKKRKEQDQKLIEKLKNYIKSESLLARCLKDKNFFSKNITFIKDPDENTCKSINNTSIFFEKRTFKDYNQNEPIYIKLESGEICTIDKVPDKKFPFSLETKEFKYIYEIKPLSRVEKNTSLLTPQREDTISTSTLDSPRYPSFSIALKECFPEYSTNSDDRVV